MGRKGTSAAWETVIGIVIALGILALAYFFLARSGGSFNNALTCDDSDPQYSCVPRAQGCGEGHKMALLKFYGCDKTDDGRSQMCCIIKPSDEAGGGSNSGTQPDVTLRAYTLTREGDAVKNLEAVNEGKTLGLLVGNEQYLMIDYQIQNCEKCDKAKSSLTLRATTPAGVDILRDVATRVSIKDKEKFVNSDSWQQSEGLIEFSPVGLDSGDDWKKGWGDKNILLTFDQRFSNQVITFRAKLSVPKEVYKENDRREYVEDEITVFFNVKPAVRYGGLTTKWEQRKSITAVCENPVKCSNIYFEIKNGSEDVSCEPPQSVSVLAGVKTVDESRKHCVIDENGKNIGCHDSQQTCLAALGSSTDTAYRQAFERFYQAIQGKTLPPEVAILWQQQENRVSRRSCQPDVTFTTERLFFKADQPDPSKARWTFTLDMPVMQNKHLCVYGQSSDDNDIFYSAGSSQVIKIDKIPPAGWIDFSPGTLRLSYFCNDQGGSGCDDTRRGIAYVTQIEDFFPALFKGDPQSATLWCPTSGYRLESRQEAVYTDEALRVMCLQVTDRAGNVGYGLTTVYNAYDTAAALLAKYVEEEREDRQEELDQQLGQ